MVGSVTAVGKAGADLKHLAPGGEEYRNAGGIEMHTALGDDEIFCHVEFPGHFVGTRRGQRVEDVGYGDDAAVEVDRFTLESARITAAVEFFMVGQGDRRRRLQHR